MSSRRKSGPPVRLDDEAAKKLNWNMTEDPQRDFEADETDPPMPSSSATQAEEDEELPGTSSDTKTASASASLSLSVFPTSTLAGVWNSLIGEFSFQFGCGQGALTLRRTGERVFLSNSSQEESSGEPGKSTEYKQMEEFMCTEYSLGIIRLEDLDWLQKRGVVQICNHTTGEAIKVGIYLLEAGLCKIEFLSEGKARLKKANQLMQKLMKYFYDFIIPELVETGVKDCDTDLERQKVEELYDYARHLHQRQAQHPGTQEPQYDVQHAALIPILRPYQSQAVNWMLRRERYRLTSPKEPSLHFLWHEVVTLCGKKLYYNPYTGCLKREFPPVGVQWPGGILADEMGLGKTMEVLALILIHSRQGLKPETLTLPLGTSVNYIPPPLVEKEKSIDCKSEAAPKVKISYLTVRDMLLDAIKETHLGKGTTSKAVFTYLRNTYGCVPLKNRIKRVLAKLINEGLVDQVKGRGLAGSFRLSKKYKGKKTTVARVAKSPPKNREASSRTTSNGEAPEPRTSEDTMPGPENDTAPPDHSQDFMSSPPADNRKPETTSTSPPPATRASLTPFSTPGYGVECICGELDLAGQALVQCMNCQLWQHAQCVNYKEESRETTPYHCPHCLVAMTPIPSGATLIISPSPICHQWVEEINRHIDSSSLRVLVYQGMKRHGFIQPRMLAEQDVVIITYTVLRSELNYVDIPHSNSKDGRRLRHQKRYMAVPSPLVAVEWWRICLDEAQMVEYTTTKTSEMALRLASVNRWCVSGTPVQRGVEDLYGLVLFLGVDPYSVKHWWDQLLYRPYRRGNTEPLNSVIGQILWRSSKKDVIDQIQIPPQTEEVHWLHFSPIEGHFYHRQHEVCSQDVLRQLRKIGDWSMKLGSLDRRMVTTILHPLLRLRQACCHPQAVHTEFQSLQNSTLTMEELLKSLQKKCRGECEEAHRQLVCALNGLAGIHIIRDEFVEAVSMYREVLRSSEEHKDRLSTDSLQRLHATHNLIEVLNAKHAGIPPALSDDRLSEEAEHLRQHYLTKHNSEVSDAHQALQPVLENIRNLKSKLNLHTPWWMDVIQRAIQSSWSEDLVSRVHNVLSKGYEPYEFTMADKFRDGRGLQLILCTQTDELMRSQKMVQEAVKRLEGPASKEVIMEATICHLRPVRLPLNNCVFCKADELFTDYESKLFAHTVRRQTALTEEMIDSEEGLVDGGWTGLPTTSRGLWAASETERALKAVLTFAKARRMDRPVVEEGNTFMELLENWKKEYKVLHEYWMVLRNNVSAIDELSMATERLRVRLPDEPNLKQLHIIEPQEVELTQVNLLNEQGMAKSQLQKKLGQLLYLHNLEKSQDKETGGFNPEPCPICDRPLKKEWAVLTCGHCFCNMCMAIIVRQYSVGSRHRAVKCATCRQITAHAEISYVLIHPESCPDQDIHVEGSYSTKVNAVLRTLKKIQQTDPGAKCLVFSMWQCVLDIISHALFENNMEFCQISGMHKFQEKLSSFKYEEKINILLLPLHAGYNGLNIIEATHILLVEPSLNPAHELQAIGRIHRIGQTKPTFVHRFLIKSTVEERMEAMMKTVEKSHSTTVMKHSAEVAVLTVADLANLFMGDVEELD